MRFNTPLSLSINSSVVANALVNAVAPVISLTAKLPEPPAVADHSRVPSLLTANTSPVSPIAKVPNAPRLSPYSIAFDGIVFNPVPPTLTGNLIDVPLVLYIPSLICEKFQSPSITGVCTQCISALLLSPQSGP